MSSDETPPEKLHVRCECGKSYKVASKNAGKLLTCKACGEKLRVPGGRPARSKSSMMVLQSLGIDPAAEARRWEEESSKAKNDARIWKCSRCAQELQEAELSGAYVQGELVCSVCRAGLVDRREEREGKPRKPEDVAILSAPCPEKARRAALFYGALFFVGFAAPLKVVAHLPLVVALGLGLVAALAGGWTVFKTRT